VESVSVAPITHIHTRYDSSRQRTGPSQRPLPENTQNTQQTVIQGPGQDSNPQSQQASGSRPALDRAATGIGPYEFFKATSNKACNKFHTQIVSFRLLTAEARVQLSGQSAWDLWWTTRHWDMLFLLVFRFSLVSITPPVLHAHSFIHIRPTVHTQCRQLRTPLNNTLGGGGEKLLK